MTTSHNPSVQDLCGCILCERGRAARLAASRATSAIQASAWRPRSIRLRAAMESAIEAREIALAALASASAEAQS